MVSRLDLENPVAVLDYSIAKMVTFVGDAMMTSNYYWEGCCLPSLEMPELQTKGAPIDGVSQFI
ncbi:unnamed protein product [Camellia sinensis]